MRQPAETGGQVILLGASVRAAAFSALRAGLRPVCGDLFADADLARHCPAQAVAGRDYPAALADVARAAPPGPWMYTGGLENHPALVGRIARDRPLWGNDAAVLTRVRDPRAVSRCMATAGLAHPRCRLVADGLPTDGSWLRKSFRGAGGGGIEPFVGEPIASDPSCYFQERIEGDSCSAVFVGDGAAAVLIGVTRQLVGEPALGAKPFAYCGSIGPLPIDAALRKRLATLGDALAAEFRLLGLFGVDCVLRDDVPWPVEVNPRYTASVEVIEHGLGIQAIALHRLACTGRRLPEIAGPAEAQRALKERVRSLEEATDNSPGRKPWDRNALVRDSPGGATETRPAGSVAPSGLKRATTTHPGLTLGANDFRPAEAATDLHTHRLRHAALVGKAVVFAPFDLAPPDLTEQVDRVSVNELPPVADIPQPGQIIRRGQPVLTVFARAAGASACRRALLRHAAEIVAACRRIEEPVSVGAPEHV